MDHEKIQNSIVFFWVRKIQNSLKIKNNMQRKIKKPGIKRRMSGRPGESGLGRASNNGVRSCNCDLLNEVAAKKLGGEG